MTSKTIYWLDLNRFDTKPDKSTWLEMGHELDRYGYDVRIVTSYKDRPYEPTNHNVEFVNIRASRISTVFKPSLLAKSVFFLLRHAEPRSIIIIPPAALIIAPLLRLFRFRNIHLDVRTVPVKVSGFKRSLDKWIFWDFALRVFSRSATSYSFITERLRTEVQKVAKHSFPEYCVWSSGVSVEMFKNDSAKQTFESATGKFNVFYHGTIMQDRGVFDLVHAMELLLQEGLNNFSLTIVGTGPDFPALERLVADSPASSTISLVGFVPYEKVPQLIASASCCICPLPARPEWQVSSPLKVFEYMAMEKPIIATRIDAHTDILRDQPFVIWTDSTDPKDISESMKLAYANRDTLFVAAKHAPTIVRDTYDWRILGERLGAFLSRRARES